MVDVGEEKLPSTLLGSATGPDNPMDIKHINRRKLYKFYLIFLHVHGSLQKENQYVKKPLGSKFYVHFFFLRAVQYGEVTRQKGLS